MNRLIRLLPDFALFATLFFVVGMYFDLDLNAFFEGAQIALPTAFALIFTLLRNAKSIHKDALSILETENRYLQSELQKVEKDLGRLKRAIGEPSVDKAEAEIKALAGKLAKARLNGNWRANAYENLLRDIDSKSIEQIKKDILHIRNEWP